VFTRRARVRFAAVGLGHFAQSAILPAFGNTRSDAELSAIVTDDDEKAAALGARYNVPAYRTNEFDGLVQSGEIDAVYVATANAKHREYTERAAAAGCHVLCEKPLAHTVQDAQAMVDACHENDVLLMTGYRLHFEEGNLKSIQMVTEGAIGKPRLFLSTHTTQVDQGNTRTKAALGGGPVEDLGVYCINAARYLFRAEPYEVTAMAASGDDLRFNEVPEAVSVTLKFSDERLAAFTCGFGEIPVSEYRVVGTEGMLAMDPAYAWQGDLNQTLTINGQKTSHVFRNRDQVAAEIIYFAKCIREKKTPEPSGDEGLIDVKIIEAIRQAYTENRAVHLEPMCDKERPTISQAIRRRSTLSPEPINAAPPSSR
jgi:predicted dehydrogenase